MTVGVPAAAEAVPDRDPATAVSGDHQAVPEAVHGERYMDHFLMAAHLALPWALTTMDCLWFHSQSISLSKLAALMNTDESAIRTHMMTLKLQTSQKEWAGEGDATEGVWTHSGDIDFYVDVDPTTGSEMVIVTETDVTKRHGASVHVAPVHPSLDIPGPGGHVMY